MAEAGIPGDRPAGQAETHRHLLERRKELRSDRVIETSYALIERTLVLQATGQRVGCNRISVITNKEPLAFMAIECTFKVPVFVTSFRQRPLNRSQQDLPDPGWASGAQNQNSHARCSQPIVVINGHNT